MLQIPSIGEIKVRADAIGVSLKQLARDAGVDPMTAYRGLDDGHGTRAKTIRKLLNALHAHEGRVRAHFAELDGAASGEGQAA